MSEKPRPTAKNNRLERLDVNELHFAEEMAPGRNVELAGLGTIFVREAKGPAGSPTVLLVHGILATADLNWSMAIPALSEHYNVVATDLRGHGDGLHTRRFDAAECADDLAALVTTLGLGRVIVVGYSLGGLVAQLFVRRHPDLVAGLVLCATACEFSASDGGPVMSVVRQIALALPEWARRATIMAILKPKAADQGRGPWLMDQVGKHDTRAILEAAGEAISFESTGWLGESDAPSAVVLTSNDSVVPPSAQREMCEVLGTRAVFEVEGDHFVCLKRPEVFNTALIGACQSTVRERQLVAA